MIEQHASDGICVVRLNSPPLNAIDFAMLEALRAAIAGAGADPAVRGVVIVGDSQNFSAGADVGLFRRIASADDAVHISRVFQQTFQALEDSPKPVVAAVAGNVMAGALELAMACHFRVAESRARFSMQEIQLAINPGAGGTQRLPRLVGLPKALHMLLTAEPIGADEALEAGLVDAVCPGEELLETARKLAASAPGPRPTTRRTDRLHDPATHEAAFDEAEKRAAAMPPEIAAARTILDAVWAGLEESVAAGMVREQTGFAHCMGTAAAQNKIYLFFATRETAKVPDLAKAEPLPVGRAAVIGMGAMGSGIAQALVTAGVSVVARDESEAALAKGSERIRRSIEKRVSAGRLSRAAADAMLGRLNTTTGWDAIADADADLVVEAVFEDVDLKRSVLGQIERVCRPEVVVASNTSTISLDALAEALDRPERLVGMHFFNPAQRMPLVEIIRREGTCARVAATAVALTKRLRKTPVVVRNREGFLVNRVFLPYLKEAFWLWEEGADPRVIDRAMVDFGFPMGPLTLIDMAGLDILALTDRVLVRAFPRHGPLSQIVARLVERGHVGQKGGSGVYKYAQGEYTPQDSPLARGIVAEVRAEHDRAPRDVPLPEITERLVLRMVAEAFTVMEEGVAGRESDLDVAMVLGTGFPDFRGGVLRYARDLGLPRVVDRLDALAEQYGERFSPCRLLRDMKGA